MKLIIFLASFLVLSFASASSYGQDALIVRKAISKHKSKISINENFNSAKKAIQEKYGSDVSNDIKMIVMNRRGGVAYLRGDVYVCEIYSEDGKSDFGFISFINECFTLQELGL